MPTRNVEFKCEIRETMSLFRFKQFDHGIHPPDSKDETNHLAIQRFPFAPLIVLPLRQHIGKPSIEIVREGEEVVRGQMIAKADGQIGRAHV